MADLSKLSANILASLKAIAAGDGKNKNAIDSQQEFSELSKLLANCTNQDDYDCILGLKLSYQTKLQNNANSIAKEFYQIADDNSGFSSVTKISALINKKINANNIVAILDAYQNPEIRHDDSSMIDTITSETGASATEQRETLTRIINVLCEAAKNAGVSENDIISAKNSFITSMNKELGAHFRRTNPKDMEKAIDFLKGAILAKQNEVANVDEDTAMQSIAQNYQSQNAQASEDFETARKEEGWTAKTGDWVCGLFGCNTEDELRAKLGDNAQKVEKLVAAANSGNKEEFKKVYKELFGIEFDANKVAVAEEYQEKYYAAVSIGSTNKAIDEILAQNLDYRGTINALKEKLKYDNETINQIMAQYNLPMETEAEKLALLKKFLIETKENCSQELKYLTQGESLEQIANKAELLAKAAFGTNDIAKDVTQFNENMQTTEMITDAAFEIAGTIALQFVPGLGQAAAVKLAASAAKWGARGYKIAQGAIKVGKGFRSANRLLTGQKFTSKAAQKGMQVGTQMVNTGVATAAVEFSSGKDMETAVKKIVMNMSFAGVGATSSMIAPKLVQAFGIESQLATEIAEELINAAGSYGVCTAAGDEYGSTDFWTDMATGLIISRLAHVKGGKGKETTSRTKQTSTETEKSPVHENDQINHILEPDQGIPFVNSIHKNILDRLKQAQSREDFKNILNVINSIPKSESGELFLAYLNKYRKWSTTQPDIRMQANTQIIENLKSGDNINGITIKSKHISKLKHTKHVEITEGNQTIIIDRCSGGYKITTIHETTIDIASPEFKAMAQAQAMDKYVFNSDFRTINETSRKMASGEPVNPNFETDVLMIESLIAEQPAILNPINVYRSETNLWVFENINTSFGSDLQNKMTEVINQYRNWDNLTLNEKKAVKNLQELIEKELNQIDIPEQIQHGFMSTSLIKDGGQVDILPMIRYDIEVMPNSHGLDIYDYYKDDLINLETWKLETLSQDREILFQRGTKQKIKHIYFDSKNMCWRATAIIKN